MLHPRATAAMAACQELLGRWCEMSFELRSIGENLLAWKALEPADSVEHTILGAVTDRLSLLCGAQEAVGAALQTELLEPMEFLYVDCVQAARDCVQETLRRHPSSTFVPSAPYYCAEEGRHRASGLSELRRAQEGIAAAGQTAASWDACRRLRGAMTVEQLMKAAGHLSSQVRWVDVRVGFPCIILVLMHSFVFPVAASGGADDLGGVSWRPQAHQRCDGNWHRRRVRPKAQGQRVLWHQWCFCQPLCPSTAGYERVFAPDGAERAPGAVRGQRASTRWKGEGLSPARQTERWTPVSTGSMFLSSSTLLRPSRPTIRSSNGQDARASEVQEAGVNTAAVSCRNGGGTGGAGGGGAGLAKTLGSLASLKSVRALFTRATVPSGRRRSPSICKPTGLTPPSDEDALAAHYNATHGAPKKRKDAEGSPDANKGRSVCVAELVTSLASYSGVPLMPLQTGKEPTLCKSRTRSYSKTSASTGSRRDGRPALMAMPTPLLTPRATSAPLRCPRRRRRRLSWRHRLQRRRCTYTRCSPPLTRN